MPTLVVVCGFRPDPQPDAPPAKSYVDDLRAVFKGWTVVERSPTRRIPFCELWGLGWFPFFGCDYRWLRAGLESLPKPLTENEETIKGMRESGAEILAGIPPDEPFFVVGVSMGGMMAAYLAAYRGSRNMLGVVAAHGPFIRIEDAPFGRYVPPVLFTYARDDMVVPAEEVEAGMANFAREAGRNVPWCEFGPTVERGMVEFAKTGGACTRVRLPPAETGGKCEHGKACAPCAEAQCVGTYCHGLSPCEIGVIRDWILDLWERRPAAEIRKLLERM